MCILSVGRLHDKPPPPSIPTTRGKLSARNTTKCWVFLPLHIQPTPVSPVVRALPRQRYRSYPISPVQEDQNKSKRELPPQPMLLDTYEIFGEMFKNLTRPDPTRDLLKTSNDPPGRFRKVPDAAGPVTLKNSWPDPSREIWKPPDQIWSVRFENLFH